MVVWYLVWTFRVGQLGSVLRFDISCLSGIRSTNDFTNGLLLLAVIQALVSLHYLV